jgi:hypothetical protein
MPELAESWRVWSNHWPERRLLLRLLISLEKLVLLLGLALKHRRLVHHR